MNIFHGNEYVEDARQTAVGTIESLKYLADRVKEGGYCGRLYSKLIEGDPINSALKAIDEYNKTVTQYNDEKDPCIDKEMEEVENQLIDTLIGMAENNDLEAIDVIRQINETIKTRNYGLQAIKRITDLNKPINFIVTLSILPEELLPLIFRNNDAKELGRLMQVSKSSCQLASKDCIWKEICLQEDPTIRNENDIPWKELYRNELDFNKYIGKGASFIIKGRRIPYKEIKVNVNSESITIKHLKQIVKKEYDLDCKISQMRLVFCGKTLMDPYLSKQLSTLQGQTNLDLVINENPPLKNELPIENTTTGTITITENHPRTNLEECIREPDNSQPADFEECLGDEEESNVKPRGDCRCIMM